MAGVGQGSGAEIAQSVPSRQSFSHRHRRARRDRRVFQLHPCRSHHECGTQPRQLLASHRGASSRVLQRSLEQSRGIRPRSDIQSRVQPAPAVSDLSENAARAIRRRASERRSRINRLFAHGIPRARRGAGTADFEQIPRSAHRRRSGLRENIHRSRHHRRSSEGTEAKSFDSGAGRIARRHVAWLLAQQRFRAEISDSSILRRTRNGQI